MRPEETLSTTSTKQKSIKCCFMLCRGVVGSNVMFWQARDFGMFLVYFFDWCSYFTGLAVLAIVPKGRLAFSWSSQYVMAIKNLR